MKHVAIGIRAHSGWGAVVAVAGSASRPEVVDRRRIEIVDPNAAGAKQPYHFVEEKPLREAERHLAGCSRSSGKLALKSLGAFLTELRHRHHDPVGCAILLASGRPLPSLEKILSSHALIHTAEGEFFRGAFRKAAEQLQIEVIGIPEKELDRRADAAFGTGTAQHQLAALGKSLGPPWTADQKLATLAALLALASGDAQTFSLSPGILGSGAR